VAGDRAPDDGPAVVLYPDVYTNYVDPARGKAAVRVLEALGCDVAVPAVPESGRAPLSQGMIATAERQAAAVASALSPHLDAGRDLIVVEPSDVAMFRRDYGKLLEEERAARLADRTFEVCEYVYGLLENGADPGALAAGDGEAVAFHAHCQARTLDLARYTNAVLEERDFDVWTSDVECCGMAGSFGYKREYYDLATAVGETLVDQVEAGAPGRRVLASGISCRDQLADLGGFRPVHPVEALDPAGE
jgi:Fe-S oxidoreductase